MKFQPDLSPIDTTEIDEPKKPANTLEEKYAILLETMEILGSYKYCDCGCPNNRAARITTRPVHVWHLANTALKNVGHSIKVYPYEA